VDADKRAGEVIRRWRLPLKKGEAQIQPLDLYEVVENVLTPIPQYPQYSDTPRVSANQRISTGVPTGAFSKNLIAMDSGNRMQPCEAG
jgi:hypothetical protein